MKFLRKCWNPFKRHKAKRQASWPLSASSSCLHWILARAAIGMRKLVRMYLINGLKVLRIVNLSKPDDKVQITGDSWVAVPLCEHKSTAVEFVCKVYVEMEMAKILQFYK